MDINNMNLLHENEPVVTYLESLGYSKEDILRHSGRLRLYHGIRSDEFHRLESIFKNRAIKCSKNVDLSFVSYTGEVIWLDLYPNYIGNCNKGEYISVMPRVDDFDFDGFVLQNIFFGIKPTVKALKTHYIPYDEYIKLRSNNIKTKNLYSYATNEFLIKDEITFDDIEFIGIDRLFYGRNSEDAIRKVKKLMEVYQIDIPFIDIRRKEELYRYQGETPKEEKPKIKEKKPQ